MVLLKEQVKSSTEPGGIAVVIPPTLMASIIKDSTLPGAQWPGFTGRTISRL